MLSIELLCFGVAVAIATYVINKVLKRRQWAAEVDKIPGPKIKYPILNNLDLLWQKGVPLAQSEFINKINNCCHF